MSKKTVLLMLFLALLLGGFFAVLLFLPQLRGLLRARFAPANSTPQSASMTQEAPLLPEVALQINVEDELAATQGVPLVFTVTLANQQATNIELENESNELYLKSVESGVQQGKITPGKAAAIKASLSNPRKIRLIHLGDEASAWNKFVHFERLGPDGKLQPLPWPLVLLAPPSAQSIVLDAHATPSLDYVLESDASAQVAPGEYQIVAVVEVPREASMAADAWRGRAESEPVDLTILPSPAKPAAADVERSQLQFAYYYQKRKDWSRALESAQKVLTVAPNSIPAQIVVGQVKEVQGDLHGALKAYQVAEQGFYQQYPDSYEAPLYLIHKSEELADKLKTQP
jgi:tetratricopeptide (TPR) repeat protein